ncbi:hypothetical protein BLA6993_03639 [Burkholderia lata]|uniref:DUF4224 domain-containing protein n=1 Tax=Burkholderia lata (strain ATCC 17760 / DSM 23089 / LMG 22485 / NCIMB 9086 / R18194 / 383) TaxID=482957 RepID=UPI0014547642|nr:DUF4224 domain-containing protein [Burkholderia lata]VWB76928.1 hypothetical protein BLA6993_03639 [Burkholderia lata]
MSLYLTTPELAELVGCKPRSHACMKRWLERNHWPFAVNIAGVPLVAREYYDARMTGAALPAPARRHRAAASEEPNFAAL